jgi:hypothetical protein
VLRLAAAASAAAALAVLLASGAALALPSGSLVQQGKKIVPGDEFIAEKEKGSEFGTSVAISADGNTAVVGGIGDEKNGSMGGAAWIYTRSGGVWSEQQKLDGGSEQKGPAQFGIGVAISADGNTVLVGGIADENKASEQVGAVWVFVRSGSTWVQQGKKLEGKGEVGLGRFGRSVALSADGNTALIGGYFDGGPKAEEQTGAAWVFTRSGSSWAEQQRFTASDETGPGQFGISAALSADGNTALIGGPHDNGQAGAAWVFTRSGSTWSQQGGKVTPKDESGEGEAGASVALSSDGNTALVGGPGDVTAGGAAWAFTRSGSTWSQQGGKLTGSGEQGAGGFGGGVALSADGNLALIGAPTDELKPLQPTGAIWEFARSGSTWSQQGSKIRGGEIAKEAEFGVAPALSADGDTAFIGGPIDEDVIGAGWAFADPPPTATTGAASGVTQSAATLGGTVAAGASNHAYFQYGTSTAYGAATAPQPLGPSGASRAVSAVAEGLSPATTYHFRIVAENSAGTNVGGDQTFTTAAPSIVTGCLCLKAPAPQVSNAKQSHSRWREGRRAANISSAKAPVGTTFSFALNETASVTFSFTQRVAGRKAGRRCVALTPRNRHGHVCKRSVTRGSLTFTGHAGTDRVAFQGVLAHGKRLPTGPYTMLIGATAPGGRSNTSSLAFTIVR